MIKTNLALLKESITHEPSFDGQSARLITLENANGMTVSFMDIGASWLSTCLPVKGEQREVLLRSTNMTEHMKQNAYFGSIVGRYANRIANGQFTLEGHSYQLDINNGKNSLHGGFQGYDKRRWTIKSQSNNHVMFTLESNDGDQGYPGRVTVVVTYTLTEQNSVEITYYAETDKATPLNLTNHAYFNLAGESSTAKSTDHTLILNADYYLPTNESLIPTGELRSVTSTSFDFRQAKSIGRDFLSEPDQEIAGGYDHAFMFSKEVTDGQQDAAVLISPDKDIVMKVKTTKPAIQFYSGNFLVDTPGASKEYQRYDGLALETQFLPDGPNHPEWKKNSGILNAGEIYQHQTSYLFEF
ncbi:galactose-1-epimerase [Psychromonas ossibalaenae]|uniref:galactose-1-epimerase n=1 Tax=Psychromonas ossibalaenae TaxID=444922 RepID=UPI00037AC122|nr:galactose-1-epimerase [Psychromonas ossibalaenae]